MAASWQREHGTRKGCHYHDTFERTKRRMQTIHVNEPFIQNILKY